MENKFNLPEDRFKKFKELEKKYAKKGAWIATKYFFLLIFLTFLTLLVNVYLFTKPNTNFAIVCGLLNGFVWFKGFKSELDIQNKEIEQDVKKIFEE